MVTNEIEMNGPATMKITYDREIDALYIRFKETTVTTTWKSNPFP